MMMEDIPTFDGFRISANGNKVDFVRNNTITDVPVVSNKVVINDVSYFIWDLVALAYLKIPLHTGIINKINNERDYHYKNLNWTPVYKDYKQTHEDVVIAQSGIYHKHSATSDGHVIRTVNKKVMREYINKDLPVKVKVPTIDDSRKYITVDVAEIVEEAFHLHKPAGATKLYYKNGLVKDTRLSNISWNENDEHREVIDNSEISPVNSKVHYSSTLEYIRGKKQTIDEIGEEDVKDKSSLKERNEESDESDDAEDGSTSDESKAEEEEGEELNDADEITILNDKVDIPEHPPIYEEFQLSDIEEDLEDCVNIVNDGKKWKVAKYKRTVLSFYYISEDMQLYSRMQKKIIDINPNKRGEYKHLIMIDRVTRSINLLDILASTFLVTPKDAVLATYRRWNKDDKKWKYFGQRNHYSNIRWLTKKDFVDLKIGPRKCKVSKVGDVYTVNDIGTYRLWSQTQKKNNLRCIFLHPFKLESHLITASCFIKKPDDTYIYCLHKDGDLSNCHYRNLIWLNTLAGIHNDGIKYYAIPNCLGYVLSETNVPFSFKQGVLFQMKLTTTKKNYRQIIMITNNGRAKIFRYHRVVCATRNKDFDENLFVDHSDQNKNNEDHTNLRAVTPSENRKNTKYKYPGKQIFQMDTQGNILATFTNAGEAAKALGIPKYGILISARENDKLDLPKKTFKDYMWKYVIKKQQYVCKSGEVFTVLCGNFQGIELCYDNYMISNFGTIIDVEKGYSKSVYSSEYDYPQIGLYKNGKGTDFTVHKLVALVHVPGRTDEKDCVNHLDEDIYNFRADNLNWVSQSENMKYSSYRLGKPVKKIDMETGKIVGVYDSRMKGSISCGKAKSVNISLVCRGDRKSAYGFYWQDIEKEEIPLYPELTINKMQAFKHNIIFL